MFDIGRKLKAALSYFGSTELADEDGVYVVRNLTRVAVAFIALSFAAGCDPSSVQDRIGVEHLRSGGYRILICPQDLVDGVGVQGPQDFNDPPGPSPSYWRIRISPPRRIYQIRLGGESPQLSSSARQPRTHGPQGWFRAEPRITTVQ